MLFFFFKQKTAYEMRISDWSSDVCSSDLLQPKQPMAMTYIFTCTNGGKKFAIAMILLIGCLYPCQSQQRVRDSLQKRIQNLELSEQFSEIGRASCRERVCQYV